MDELGKSLKTYMAEDVPEQPEVDLNYQPTTVKVRRVNPIIFYGSQIAIMVLLVGGIGAYFHFNGNPDGADDTLKSASSSSNSNDSSDNSDNSNNSNESDTSKEILNIGKNINWIDDSRFISDYKGIRTNFSIGTIRKELDEQEFHVIGLCDDPYDTPIRYGIIDQNFNVIVEFKYSYMHQISYDKCLAVDESSKYGIIDYKGNIMMPFIYDQIYNPTDSTLAPKDDPVLHAQRDGKHYLTDVTGKLLNETAWDFISLDFYDEKTDNTVGHFAALGERYYCLGDDGKILYEIDRTPKPDELMKDDIGHSLPKFENLIKVYEQYGSERHYGVQDKHGNTIVETKYYNIALISEDLIIGQNYSNDYQAVIYNGKGEVISTAYDYVNFMRGRPNSPEEYYSNYGIASIYIDDNSSEGTHYLIDRKGEVLSEAYESYDQLRAEWDLDTGKRK